MFSDDLKKDLQIVWQALLKDDEPLKPAEVVVVGGTEDVGVADRAAELYHQKLVNKVIISGYKPEWSDVSEAELLAGRCIELGVPDSDLILDKNASNTGENITLSARLADSPKSVILIHKPYMTLRFFATAEKQWPEPKPKFQVTCQRISFDDYINKFGLEKVARVMLGDFKRMDEYVAKGFQTKQFVPNGAKDAYSRLVSAGLDIR